MNSADPAINTKRHIAIIMDGNGRWALKQGRSRLFGHQAGAERLRGIVEACPEAGVGFLTVFAFSTENWKRGATEVVALTDLFHLYMRREAPALLKSGVKLRFIGDRSGLDAALASEMVRLERETAGNHDLTLTVAINYGSRNEIVHAARQVAQAAIDGQLSIEDIDEPTLAAAMFTSGLPDPDLIIRTSGESRLSNFLLWQGSYAEIDIVATPWPDFSVTHFKACVERFNHRQRRFGALS